MHTVSLAQVAAQPWRNGGGVTQELLAWPVEGAGSDWQLRISVARIESDGPFSAFPGIERWFAVLQGEGVVLHFANRRLMLGAGSEPVRFEGAAAPGCDLLDGPTQDLNLMVRSDAGRGAMLLARGGDEWLSSARLRAVVTLVAATRAASDEALFHSAAARARTLMQEGLTTLEIKSGYGLSAAHEARCLAVARRIGAELPLTVRTTSLAAHTLPLEYAGRADDYIAAACGWLAEQHAAGLVDAVDAFCDTIGFTPAQTERIFQAAQLLGLPVKLHAEQLSDQGGAALAARYSALSCDHLEHLSAAGIHAMRSAGTVAMLLPGAYYFLRETKLPPVQALRDAGVPMAIATDHNPGSSPVLSLLLMLNMACTLFRLTPEEAWRGVTVHAAQALGLPDRGTLAAGQRADFVVWDAEHPREMAYRFGHNPCRRVVFGGVERGTA